MYLIGFGVVLGTEIVPVGPLVEDELPAGYGMEEPEIGELPFVVDSSAVTEPEAVGPVAAIEEELLIGKYGLPPLEDEGKDALPEQLVEAPVCMMVCGLPE